MTPPPVVESPTWARVDAAVPTPWRGAGNLSVVHLGHSALVLQGLRGQLVVTSDAFGLVPGGVQLRPVEFAVVRRGLLTGGALGDWRPDVVEPADLRMGARAISAAAVELLAAATAVPRSVGAFDPARQRAAAPALAAAALHGTVSSAQLRALVGAGPGSTPAGDDVVAGVLAGLLAAGHSDAAAHLSRLVLPLLPRTTAASAHYLAAAADGRFADRVHELADGLRDLSSAARAVDAASRFGATSGADLLAGLAAAARTALELRKSA